VTGSPYDPPAPLPPPLKDEGRDTVLCALDDIADPGGKGFRVGRRKPLFVLRKDGAVYGYRNACPHTGVSLDWQPDVFLSPDKRWAMCSMHCALFRIEDGYCVAGPCVDRSLTPVKVRVDNGRVMLDE
jgi:nitrite reductase/ring-hydroxylating ferredoxin subunit